MSRAADREDTESDALPASWVDALLRDDEVDALFTAEADLAAMLRVEAALAGAQAAHGHVPESAARRIAGIGRTFVPDARALLRGMRRDGVVVPALVEQLRAAAGEAAPHVHAGATSQDIVDTSLVLRLAALTRILDARLAGLDDELDALTARFGAHALSGRTRMRAALPITVADRIDAWRTPLVAHRETLAALAPRLLRLQLGGPTGTPDAAGPVGEAVARTLAAELGLGRAAPCWHTARAALVELSDWLSRVGGSLGKMGQDIALMGQDGVDEVRLSGAGGSSAMPHKANPVAAELLVSLARANATRAGGMQHAMVHEQERSGAAWALEWMLLPPTCRATGAALLTARTLLRSVERLGEPPG